MVALVGATGTGKSLLASLLPRLADVQSGSVQVGSDSTGWHDLRDLDLADLRRRVQVLPQESFLFSDSLAANLHMAAPQASDPANNRQRNRYNFKYGFISGAFNRSYARADAPAT